MVTLGSFFSASLFNTVIFAFLLVWLANAF